MHLTDGLVTRGVRRAINSRMDDYMGTRDMLEEMVHAWVDFGCGLPKLSLRFKSLRPHETTELSRIFNLEGPNITAHEENVELYGFITHEEASLLIQATFPRWGAQLIV